LKGTNSKRKFSNKIIFHMVTFRNILRSLYEFIEKIAKKSQHA